MATDIWWWRHASGLEVGSELSEGRSSPHEQRIRQVRLTSHQTGHSLCTRLSSIKSKTVYVNTFVFTIQYQKIPSDTNMANNAVSQNAVAVGLDDLKNSKLYINIGLSRCRGTLL
jgi:hypothetical protein